MEMIFNKYIADVTKPDKIGLASNPNFVTFESKIDKTEDQRMEATITIRSRGEDKKNISILLKEKGSGKKHFFYGTYESQDSNNKTFLLIDQSENVNIDSTSSTIYNFRQCLLKNPFIKNNFDVIVPLWSKDKYGNLIPNEEIKIVSKGYGNQYNFDMTFAYGNKTAEICEGNPDVRISLLDVDYSTVKEDDFAIVWGTRPGMLASLKVTSIEGLFEQNNQELGNGYFQIVLPNDNLSKIDADFQTLSNMKKCMEGDPQLNSLLFFLINKQEKSIDCWLSKNEKIYRFCYVDKMSLSSPFSIIQNASECSSEDPEINNMYRFYFDRKYATSSDSIDSGTGERQIELDIYTNTRAFLGDYSGTDEVCEKGTYITSLTKSYFGEPLWFDLNGLIAKRVSYSPNFLTILENEIYNRSWIDTGTIIDYRFVAKRINENIIEPFYFSDVHYSLNGYDYTLNKVDLEDYVLKINQDFSKAKYDKVKPLTTNRERTHIKWQRQYFNFILHDIDHFRPSEIYHQIGLSYKLYTQSGTFIGEKIDQLQISNQFTIINTALLRLDQFLPLYKGKTVGRIDVALIISLDDVASEVYYQNVIVSEALSYRILPSYLHKVNDFAFLNRLGGWDSFNFGGSTSNEFKTTASTIYKTLTPDFFQQTEIESVISKTVEEKLTVQTSPINVEVVEWLRELSASTAVYELSTKRYVIVEDMALKYNTNDDLFQIEMKYHYSDTFNTKIK